MISYEVTAEVEARLAAEFERYMRETHIPEVLATGCFLGAIFARSSAGRYRTSYLALGQAELDRYLEAHTTALRQDFARRFPDGIGLAREVWTAVERWDAGPVRTEVAAPPTPAAGEPGIH
jgi:hypothetical protein